MRFDSGRSTRPAGADVVGLAMHLGVTERFVRGLVHKRRIAFYKVGRLLIFDLADVEHWLAQNRVDPVRR